MNKTRSYLHIFFKKIEVTHHCFKNSLSIWSNWIDRVYFLHFFPSKIRVSPIGVVYSLSPPRCHLSSGRRRHTIAPCHSFFPLNQYELTASASSFGNALSCHLPSRAETEALNLHHHNKPPSSDRLTPALHWYKKIISTLVTLPITQSRLHFISSLARAPRYRSSACHLRFLSPLSHAYHPSTQWHPHWRTSRLSFASRTAYQYVNSHKKIF
jgi:hypothetical protein